MFSESPPGNVADLSESADLLQHVRHREYDDRPTPQDPFGIYERPPSASEIPDEEKEIWDSSYEKLRLVGLDSKAFEESGNLSFGELKLLEIARALASEPILLLLDEPAAGLTVQESNRIMNLILKIREKGTTVLLVEHNMKLVMKISNEVLVLNYGRKIAEGPPVEIQKNEEVVEIYLGKDVHFA